MKIEVEVPDGKKAEWVNGVLTLVDEKPIEYKFKVGDKVKCPVNPSETYTIKSIGFQDGKYLYALESDTTKTYVAENLIEPIPQNIIERIKTFEDACDWCRENGKKEMTEVYGFIHYNLSNMEGGIDEEDKDIIAYLKLRKRKKRSLIGIKLRKYDLINCTTS